MNLPPEPNKAHDKKTLISHRGNINGRIPNAENNPAYIKDALNAGYDCEVDVWYIDHEFWLGHDKPQHPVSGSKFLQDPRIWCHAKNLEALRVLLNLKVHCFWHQKDDYTITNAGWIWAYPGKPGNRRAIAVMPEQEGTDVTGFGGVCSDYIASYVEK
jgi:hypothetical protein